MAQLISDLLIFTLVISFACIVLAIAGVIMIMLEKKSVKKLKKALRKEVKKMAQFIAGVIVKTLEIKERKELKRAYRQKLNKEFKQVMNEIGESASECYEVLNDEN